MPFVLRHVTELELLVAILLGGEKFMTVTLLQNWLFYL
jgi:hypothetical protein